MTTGFDVLPRGRPGGAGGPWGAGGQGGRVPRSAALVGGRQPGPPSPPKKGRIRQGGQHSLWCGEGQAIRHVQSAKLWRGYVRAAKGARTEQQSNDRGRGRGGCGRAPASAKETQAPQAVRGRGGGTASARLFHRARGSRRLSGGGGVGCALRRAARLGGKAARARRAEGAARRGVLGGRRGAAAFVRAPPTGAKIPGRGLLAWPLVGGAQGVWCVGSGGRKAGRVGCWGVVQRRAARPGRRAAPRPGAPPVHRKCRAAALSPARRARPLRGRGAAQGGCLAGARKQPWFSLASNSRPSHGNKQPPKRRVAAPERVQREQGGAARRRPRVFFSLASARLRHAPAQTNTQ
ncbi:MAG: hypothetical protein J3K34DRAFT_251313 [Monoraphidium minutum]|nr:MAG: hypothetical protein J3K34DRAFT_251313 [Monoraphidium minutum]